MFKLTAYGQVGRYVEEGVLLDVSHHVDGYNAPVVVRIDRDRALVSRAKFPPGAKLWVTGDGYQYREDGFVRLAIKPSAVAAEPPSTPRPRRAALWSTLHASIKSDVVTEVIRKGSNRASCEEEKLIVCRFQVYVRVPEMPPGIPVVLRCRHVARDPELFADGIALLDEEDRLLARDAVRQVNDVIYLGKHRKGDRVNLEGVLQELRFTDSGGQPRTKHQLLVRRWWYARDRAAMQGGA